MLPIPVAGEHSDSIMASRNDSQNSIIGPGTIFEGKFYISGSLRVDGKFEGDIRTSDSLVVGETGKVKTNIHARSVTIAGTMIGNIKAEEDIRLEKSGKIMGDVEAPIIHLAPGVVLRGSVNITGGVKKDTKKLIEESYGGTPPKG